MVDYLHKAPKCHVSIPLSQCDMGRKVVSSDEEFTKIWIAISKVHWEAHIEGLPQCLKQYIHPETWKFEKKKAFGNFAGASAVLLAGLALAMLI